MYWHLLPIFPVFSSSRYCIHLCKFDRTCNVYAYAPRFNKPLTRWFNYANKLTYVLLYWLNSLFLCSEPWGLCLRKQSEISEILSYILEIPFFIFLPSKIQSFTTLTLGSLSILVQKSVNFRFWLFLSRPSSSNKRSRGISCIINGNTLSLL